MKFEDLLEEVGGYGRFQLWPQVHVCLTRIILPLHFLLHNFLGAIPSHHCTIPDLEALANLTQEEKLVVSIPRDPEGTFSSCKVFSKPQFHLLLSNSSQGADNDSSVEQCQHGWVYDHSQFTSTIVTKWDLVCEKKGLNQLTATLFFVGTTVGSLVFGILADKYGRKPLILLSFILTALFGLMSAFSTSYLMFAVGRTLTGFAITGLSGVCLGLCMEWVDVKHRTFAGALSTLFWSLGCISLALLAYLIRDWRQLLLVATSPCVIGIILYWWIPESARWLLATGKTEKAHRYLSRCAKINRREKFTIKPISLRQIVKEEDTDRNYSSLDLMRTPQIRKRSIILGITWLGVALTYYGISFNIRDFGLDMYLTQLVFGAIEFPAKLAIYFLLDRIGRRHCVGWMLILTGILLGVNIFVPNGLDIVRSVFGILGKGFSEAAFFSIIIYTVELYPTVIRQNGIGYTAVLARIGGSVAPLLSLLEDVWKLFPLLIFCVVAIVSGAITFLLPETLNKRLPETIGDVEDGRNQSPYTLDR
ncbi:solute carrier family 22 member 7-like [Latimeria chalumnae]|uniref:solute carrier family 22 member 7-like n=1 Tax=Latimeria chalumnae TaxID=7897 RepID=UPI00313E1DFB